MLKSFILTQGLKLFFEGLPDPTFFWINFTLSLNKDFCFNLKSQGLVWFCMYCSVAFSIMFLLSYSWHYNQITTKYFYILYIFFLLFNSCDLLSLTVLNSPLKTRSFLLIFRHSLLVFFTAFHIFSIKI
jgi:hypothetical protein